MIWYESGGEGKRTVLLLHGLGATAAVWKPLERALEKRKTLRWVAPDLGGHGASEHRASYSVGQLAAQLAELLQQEQPAELFIVGHSLGAYLGLALASGWFAVTVRGVLGIGPKIDWPDADVQAARELAARPVRCYPTEEEAWTRYRRVSGLSQEIAPDEVCLARGVTRGEGGWRLAQDPRTFAVAGAPFASLAASARVPVRLARGAADHMVSLGELRAHDPQARELPGTGHNAHIEDPAAVLALLQELEDA
ncbi:MAG TPA: alpha/beta hydrolase [Steroidobacteraceae bacterium]|nr:alpha/beta hydrolase [Steroidobacteraceae bacterium]